MHTRLNTVTKKKPNLPMQDSTPDVSKFYETPFIIRLIKLDTVIKPIILAQASKLGAHVD
jgi:hypothetical protein